ncbi:MAG: dephospho-CoA kinase [Bacteroidales bacterium]|nr:dephospho-CoA kinase [Bacteroidales bacterium]
MLKVGLTGNMGSGKSTVASIFSTLHVPVYHADLEAKKMYQRDDVLKKTVSLAGDKILDLHGNLDRQALAKVAFSNPTILQSLNQLIHPLVREDFIAWTAKHHHYPYIIHEAAIIFESGFREEYDKVIYVSCPESIAIDRIERRDHLSVEMIRQRMQFQLPDNEKTGLADFVVLNDGNTLVIPQVLKIHQDLLKRSA